MTVRLALAPLFLLIAGAAGANLDPSSACCARKLRLSGPSEARLFRCHATAAAHGEAVAAACLSAAGASLARRFARAEEAGGCSGVGDAGRIEADLERIVGLVANTLRPSPARSACAARKLKTAGRFAASVLKAFAGEAPHPADHLDALDPVIADLSQRVQATFTRLEGGTDCLTTADAPAVTALITAGPTPPVPADGALLASLRLCPACGDDVQGGTEQCDGFDAFTCNGPCRADCTCPICGDGAIDQTSEACDGADDAACHRLCLPDCTCPAPVCGNGVKESGEQCDGSDAGGCASACQSDCTCAAVCGNGVIEPGEQCEGATCFDEGFFLASCAPPGPRGCQCCDGGICPILGCCDPVDICLVAPNDRGSCFPTQCRPDHPCSTGYTCVPNPSQPGTGICAGGIGSTCTYFTPIAPCFPPAVCSASSGLGFCCLPSGETCASAGDCCSRTCNGGTCG
ncbi:MAG TPA: hypothetical protein VMS22_00075 [Candidatus Eisenbacteria bacterium]|nr:hypothetical protein [Candidatus Eisenbacteria bacterium]